MTNLTLSLQKGCQEFVKSYQSDFIEKTKITRKNWWLEEGGTEYRLSNAMGEGTYVARNNSSTVVSP